jgi:hypothetical protein
MTLKIISKYLSGWIFRKAIDGGTEIAGQKNR